MAVVVEHSREQLLAQLADLKLRHAIVTAPENNPWLLEDQIAAAEWLLGDAIEASPAPPKPPWDETWAERNSGWEHADMLDRKIQVRRSRFHGLMVGVDNHWAYVGEAEPSLLLHLLATR